MSEQRKCEQCGVVFLDAQDFSAHWATCLPSGAGLVGGATRSWVKEPSERPVTRAEFDALKNAVRILAVHSQGAWDVGAMLSPVAADVRAIAEGKL